MHEVVKDYYGTQLQSSADLRTTTCCDFTAMKQAACFRFMAIPGPCCTTPACVNTSGSSATLATILACLIVLRPKPNRLQVQR